MELEAHGESAGGLLIKERGGKALDNVWKARGEDELFVPPRERPVAGGAEALRRGSQRRAARHACGRKDACERVLPEIAKCLEEGHKGSVPPLPLPAKPDALPSAALYATLAERLRRRVEDVKVRPVPLLNVSADGGALQGLLPEARAVPLGEVSTGSMAGVVSSLAVSFAPQPLEMLWQMGRVLAPDGLLTAALLGHGSFRELRETAAALDWPGSPVGPLPDLTGVAEALQNLGLKLPVVDRDVLTLTATSFDKLLAFRAAHGARNTHPQRPRGMVTPRRLAALAEAYAARHRRPDGLLPLTVEVIYVHAVRPEVWAEAAPLPAGARVRIA